MVKFKKKVFPAGIYKTPDGPIDITPSRMNHWCNQYKRMSASGLRIPIPWGHQEKARPETYEEREFRESKFNVGYIESMKVEQDEGQPVLTIEFDAPLKEDNERIGTSVKEVSPQIESSYVDGKGRVWNDVITHIALVTQPVVPGQDNFEVITDYPIPKNAVRLSLSNKISGDYKMAEKEEKKEEKKEPVKVENHAGNRVKKVLDLLKDIGAVLPEDTDENTFVERLETALLTLKEQLDKFNTDTDIKPEESKDDTFKDLEAALGGGDKDKDKDKEKINKEKPEDNPQEVPPTMTMNLKGNKEYEITIKRLSLTEKKLEEAERTSMSQSIENLLNTGRITPAIAAKLGESVKVYKLSLRADTGDEEPSLVKAQIESFKLMPEGAAWATDEKIKMRNASEADLPTSFGSLSEDDAEKFATMQLKVSGKGFASN